LGLRLSESEGQVYGPSGAASKLGIAQSTLESKIRSLKINKKRFKTYRSFEEQIVHFPQRISGNCQSGLRISST